MVHALPVDQSEKIGLDLRHPQGNEVGLGRLTASLVVVMPWLTKLDDGMHTAALFVDEAAGRCVSSSANRARGFR
ncbi:MAG: hypothetical protein H0T75_19205 [Rhizobiales bacterium]|nr:hypothetical protein [Hyphomicrobiales bacterium]